MTDPRILTVRPGPDDYACTFGGAPPVARIAPGTVLDLYTEDCFAGRVRSEKDLASEVCEFPFLNPQTGPFHIEGAEPGDTVAVHFVSVEPARDWAASTTVPLFGALTSTHSTATLQPPLPETVWIWQLDRTRRTALFRGREGGIELELPLDPMHGTVGVAPANLEVRSALVPDAHGGKMDTPEMRAGVTCYLGVNVEGALLSLGDGHARQGEGETCGVAVEWSTGLKLTSVTDPSGLALATTYSYDSDGNLLSTTGPNKNSTTETVTTYWSATGSGACQGRPEWAGLTCQTAPGTTITGGGSNPSELVTKSYAYDLFGEPTSVTETANGSTRTTAYTRDAAGRPAPQGLTESLREARGSQRAIVPRHRTKGATMVARLAGFLPGDLTEEQAAVYQAISGGPRAAGPQLFALTDSEGRLRGPFNAMLLSPPVGAALQTVGAAVRYQSLLSDRVREMAVLLVAAHWGSAFEREAHEAVGRACGLTEEELGSLRSGALPPLTDPDEMMALRTTASLLSSDSLGDDQYNAAVSAIGERGLFELTTLVGYYSTLALQLRVFAGEEGEPRPSAP